MERLGYQQEIRWLWQAAMVVFLVTVDQMGAGVRFRCLSGTIWDQHTAARRAG